jgi:hypothetical protein
MVSVFASSAVDGENVDGNLVFLDCDALGYSVIFAWRIFRTMYIIFRLLLVHVLT